MGDPRVQSRKLRVELKVHEPKWINYGHFTRPRSHEEELGRARSSLERANLKDYQYFMTIDPFVHKSPSDRYLIHLMVFDEPNSFLLSSKSCLVGNILTIKSGLSRYLHPILWCHSTSWLSKERSKLGFGSWVSFTWGSVHTPSSILSLIALFPLTIVLSTFFVLGLIYPRCLLHDLLEVKDYPIPS